MRPLENGTEDGQPLALRSTVGRLRGIGASGRPVGGGAPAGLRHRRPGAAAVLAAPDVVQAPDAVARQAAGDVQVPLLVDDSSQEFPMEGQLAGGLEARRSLLPGTSL